jgi:hypothetical protein
MSDRLRVAQSARHEGDGWWRWAVWLEGDGLDGVESVEYTLHPTFPKPHVHVRDRSDGFRIERTGWGGFRIFLIAHRKDGSSVDLDHMLELREEKGVEAPMRGLPSDLFEFKELAPPPDADRDLAAQHPPRTGGAGSGGGKDRPRRILLSNSLANSDIADSIRAQLAKRGIEVVSADDLAVSAGLGPGGLDEETDAAVVVLDSGSRNSWTVRDAETARAAGLKVIPVVVDDDRPTGLPEWLEERKTLRADRSAPEEIALEISDEVEGYV